MTFVAKFWGFCVICHQAIGPGDPIDVVSPVGYRHAECAPDREQRHTDVCPVCHTEKSLTGECLCD